MENSAADRQRSEENPLLLKLKQILIETYREESDMRGIVFVRTRLLAEIIANWMSETDELKPIKAKKCTGAGAQITEGGITKLFCATIFVQEVLTFKSCDLSHRFHQLDFYFH